MRIKCLNKFQPAITKPKRIKILVGGRSSTKSTFAADYVLACMSQGQLWCCSREFQNSIDESVHRLMEDEIDRIGLEGFTVSSQQISHASGGRNFYRGLARNIASIKSMLSGVDGLWIEEGEALTENTLRVLTASLRLNAKDSERVLAGEDVRMPEIWITMNRGSTADPVAKKWLHRAEPALARKGYYEDDMLMVIEANYTDMPKSWFLASGLDAERKDDEVNLPKQQYDHKWHGKYLETVENSIIQPEWFDAAVDAHKKSKAFKPRGVRVTAYDPFDDGADAAAIAGRHGSIIDFVKSKDNGEIDACTDWAVEEAKLYHSDWFFWDGDGMGTGLKRQVALGFHASNIQYEMFRGSLKGIAMDDADLEYDPGYGEHKDSKTKSKYQDIFYNNRARYYIDLARRCHNTYLHIVKGEYIDPDDMIAFNSEGIDDIESLKSQLCRIPKKEGHVHGLIQLMGKKEMKDKYRIQSPNEADAVMMTMKIPKALLDFGPESFEPDEY